MKIINCILELTALNLYQISCSVLGSCSAQALTQSSSKASLNADIGKFSATAKKLVATVERGIQLSNSVWDSLLSLNL